MDWRERIDPELRPLVPVGGPVLGDLQLEELPALFEQRRAHGPPSETPGVDVVDVDDAGAGLRIYAPRDRPRPQLPCVYAMHGGGFIVGSNRMDGDVLAARSAHLRCVCVSVDYRLAPEATYPAAIDDCEAGLRWVLENADRLRIDPDRVVLSGVSAGGALATSLALRLRDGGLHPLGLLLEAPTLDDREHAPSRSWDVPIAGPSTVRLGWQAYLGARAGSSDVPEDAAPARATDLTGLPATFIGVGTVDILHDEAVDFAHRLGSAGVDVTLREYPGAVHGFASLAPGSRLGQRFRRDQRDWLTHRMTR